jgi:hypothetical protein
MQARVNLRLANAIRHAVAIDAKHGAAQAWAYLTAHEVPRQTILRVLSGQIRRRASDNVVDDDTAP